MTDPNGLGERARQSTGDFRGCDGMGQWDMVRLERIVTDLSERLLGNLGDGRKDAPRAAAAESGWLEDHITSGMLLNHSRWSVKILHHRMLTKGP